MDEKREERRYMYLHPKNNSWRLILTRVKFCIVDSPVYKRNLVYRYD